jgi:hypothetical protein
MAGTAKITSLDAIESFRAALLVFLGKARPTLEEISGEILRTRQWLQHDQRHHWETEVKKRARKLEEARAELFSAKLSRLQESSALQLMAVQRTERATREAEAKLAVIKKWDRDIENRTDPLLKQTEQLQTYLTTDMGKAVAYLEQVVRAVEAYTDVSRGGNPGSTA